MKYRGEVMRSKFALAFLFILTVTACSSPDTSSGPPEVLPSGFVSGEAAELALAENEMATISKALNDSNTADDAFFTMVQDLGGFSSYADALDTQSEAELVALHTKYKLGYTNLSELSTQNDPFPEPWICPYHYSDSYKNKTFVLSNQTVHIDASGRPLWALMETVPGQQYPASFRSRNCQDKVRDWGGRGGSSATDAGGHLIASSMGGWAYRANLVPQNITLNNGLWSRFEEGVKNCMGRRWAVRYTTTVFYPDNDTIRPNEMHQNMILIRFLFNFIPIVSGTADYAAANESWYLDGLPIDPDLMISDMRAFCSS